MNINQLQYFVAVANMHSMNKAADSLFITHQCLSVAIKNLEKEMGAKLFRRSNEGTFLTAEGEIVYRMAEDVLGSIAKAKDSISNKAAEEQVSLKIFASLGMSMVSLMNLAKEFKKKNEHIMLLLQGRSSLEALKLLEEDKADMIYIGLPSSYDVERFPDNTLVYNVYKEKLRLLLPQTHPLAKCKYVSLKTVAQYPLVFYQQTLYDESSIMFKKIMNVNKNANIALISDNMDMCNEAVASGMGLGFIANSVIKSKMLNEKIVKLGLTTVSLKNGFEPNIFCLVNKNVWQDKQKLLAKFDQDYQENMYMEKIEK